MDSSKLKIVYVIAKGKGEKEYWNRIGAAFVNRDGSLSVKLDAVPVGDARMHIRDYVPREDGNSFGESPESLAELA